jgi:hypothetical protein
MRIVNVHIICDPILNKFPDLESVDVHLARQILVKALPENSIHTITFQPTYESLTPACGAMIDTVLAPARFPRLKAVKFAFDKNEAA